MNERHIKYADELLQQIVDGLNRLGPRTMLDLVEVTFWLADDPDPDTGAEFEFSLAQALHALANDLYWDERGNWSEARIANVRSK